MARATRQHDKAEALADGDIAERILEIALDLAEDRGWAAVRLTDVADHLDIPASRVLDFYRDLDAVADAWFRRALDAMLAAKTPDFGSKPAAERLEICLLAWFDSVSERKRISVEMLETKLEFSHPHHWVPAIFNLSRTIQWLRQAAQLPAPYGTRRAQVEEIGLSLLFLAMLRTWVRDESPDRQRTRDVLRDRLARADRLMVRLFGPARPDE
ncbi:MAG: hypothetical protein MI741_18815 [Rhodospirillales bacterium]|nr:hypothetical protein [Rhodospirillales bacterium]